jgi:hypothetical protein
VAFVELPADWPAASVFRGLLAQWCEVGRRVADELRLVDQHVTARVSQILEKRIGHGASPDSRLPELLLPADEVIDYFLTRKAPKPEFTDGPVERVPGLLPSTRYVRDLHARSGAR